MKNNIVKKAAFQDYGELWNYNLQKIEQIQRSIETSISDLENSYGDFEPRYEEIMQRLDILSSIYSGYNTLAGGEYILRLKSVLTAYRKRYTREGLDFNLLHYLLVKISDARNACFEQFPALSHGDMTFVKAYGGAAGKTHKPRKHNWLTFERNRSWFIVKYGNIDIRKNENFPIVSVQEPDFINVEFDDVVIKVKDIFIKSLEHPGDPRYYILLDRARKNFAANRLGKQVHSDRDFITPHIKPFRTVKSNALSPGRIRLFGRNHIVLR
ncbi:MAG: hypothetical protein A2176_05920 [Spirochaetes bacterium RBG_13_51_14]|nr:MAG: hypothetical protein A2176_05920 [Spirochaetes bacterium RBG_13_51_14]